MTSKSLLSMDSFRAFTSNVQQCSCTQRRHHRKRLFSSTSSSLSLRKACHPHSFITDPSLVHITLSCGLPFSNLFLRVNVLDVLDVPPKPSPHRSLLSSCCCLVLRLGFLCPKLCLFVDPLSLLVRLP